MFMIAERKNKNNLEHEYMNVGFQKKNFQRSLKEVVLIRFEQKNDLIPFELSTV